MQKSARDFQQPFPSARKCSDQGMAAVEQIDDAKHSFGSLCEQARGEVVEHRVKPEVFLRRETIVERLILEHEADASPHFIRIGENVKTRHGRFTCGGPQQCRQNFDRGRLSGSVWSKKTENLARFDLELDIVYSRNRAKCLDQIFDVDDVHSRETVPRYQTQDLTNVQFPMRNSQPK